MAYRFARVRIAVAVALDGSWRAVGGSDNDDGASMQAAASGKPGEKLCWVTARVPAPDFPEVDGEVSTEEVR